MDSLNNTIGPRGLAMIDAAIAMRRAYEGKEQLEPLTADGSSEPFIITAITVQLIYYNGPVRDIPMLTVPENFRSTASLKTIITERNKLAATYGEAPIAE